MRACPAAAMLAALLLAASCGGGDRPVAADPPPERPEGVKGPAGPGGPIFEPAAPEPESAAGAPPPPPSASAPQGSQPPPSSGQAPPTEMPAEITPAVPALPTVSTVPPTVETAPPAEPESPLPAGAEAGSPEAEAPPEEALPAPPPSHPTGLPFHSWVELRMVASGGLGSRGEVTLTRRPGRYRPPDRGKARKALLIRSRATASALYFFDAEIESTSEIDPADGSTLEMVELNPGKRAKLLRVKEDKLRLVRFEPPKGRRDASLREWKITDKSSWKRPEEGGVQPPLYDFYALVGALDRFPVGTVGDHLDLWLATSSGPLPMRVEVIDRRRRNREIVDLAGKRTRRVRLEELRIRLRPLTDDPDQVRGFLSMQGETELWIEARSHMLLEVRGRVPHIGEVVVLLEGLR